MHGGIAEGLPIASSHQHRDLGHHHNRVDFARHGLKEEAHAALASGAGIVMRVVGVGDQGGGMVDHALGDIGMQIEGGDDGNLVAQPNTNLHEEVALGIVFAIRQHRAMQREEHAVEFACQRDVLQQPGLEL